MFKKLFIALLLFCICSVETHGKYEVLEFMLKNGLHVKYIKKSTSPIIEFSIWYRCGSSYDAISKSGVAHYLEHMAFCSDNGFFDEFLEKIGAERNAFTSLKTICFYEIVPSEHIEAVFKHEAIRMESMSPNNTKFITERGAIIEERNMKIDTNPSGQYQEVLSANLFNRMPGGISIIGLKSEIESITEKDLLDFHNKWFCPNNATLIIVGDIEFNQVKHLTEKYFGRLNRKNIATINKAYPIPTFEKDINFSSPKNGSSAEISYIYSVPFQGKSNFRKCISLKLTIAMLNQADFFVRKTLETIINKASSVDFQYITGYFPYDIVVINISCNSINNCVDCEKIWDQYLKNKIVNIKLKKEDLDIIKKREIISMAYKKDDIKQISEHFGFMITSGFDVEHIQSLDDIIQSITIDECQSALREIFTISPCAISRITPKGYDRE